MSNQKAQLPARREPNNPQISPEQLQLLLEVQQRNFEIQEQQIRLENSRLELAKQSDSNQLLYVTKQVEATLQDNQSERDHRKLIIKWTLWVVSLLGVSFLVLCGFSIHLGKYEAVKDFTQMLAFGSALVAGAYQTGKAKGKSGNDTNNT